MLPVEQGQSEKTEKSYLIQKENKELIFQYLRLDKSLGKKKRCSRYFYISGKY